MNLESRLAGLAADEKPSAVTVGTFDGVHLGHQRLLEQVVAEARQLRAPDGPDRGAAVAITFTRPPRAVIEPGVRLSHLCPLDERLRLLKGLGLDAVIPMDFDDEVRLTTARDFAAALKRHLNLAVLVIGPNSSIGHDVVGDEATLRAIGKDIGFEVRVLAQVLHGGIPLRSSAIRAALAEGRVVDAAAMLGRPYALSGTVSAGDRRGRDLGFPTANLAADAGAGVPLDGVYAAWAAIDGVRHAAAVSIGTRPTFHEPGGATTIEAFLLDFQGDLYGKKMRLEFAERLRKEKRFPNAEALVQQMTRDVEAARRALATADRRTETGAKR